MKRVLSIFIMVLAVALMLAMPATKELIFCSKKVAYGSLAEPSIKDALNLKSKSCVLTDANTGKILYADNSSARLAPASMTKVMTMLLVMEEIEKGNLQLNQEVTISEHSASQEGSECFLDAHKSYSIEELIKAVAVASANDACVALAEAVSGDEKLFVNKMNARAKELNMTNTNYVNSTGLDEENHYSTAEDLTKVIKELSKYQLIAELEKTWMYNMQHSNGRVTELTNTNRLIRNNKDCYMAKTGHTDNAGYCIVVYGKRAEMELIACVMGLNTSEERFSEVTKLLNYGFTNFESKKVISSDTPLGEIDVAGGKVKRVQYFVEGDIFELTKKGESVNCETVVTLNSEKINAPIAKGEMVGVVEVIVNGEVISKANLITKTEVEEKTIKDLFIELIGAKKLIAVA